MQIDMFPTWLSQKAAVPALSFPFALRGRAVAAKSQPPRIGSAPFVESLDYDAAAAHTRAWQSLAAQALEPNIFAEPAFALAAAQHFAGVHRPRFLFVWAGGVGERGELLAVCPMYVPGRFESRRLALSWICDQAPLATPLLDARRAGAALDALLAFAREDLPVATGFVFRTVPRFGATAVLLQNLAHTHALAFEFGASRTQPSSQGTREPGSMLLAAPRDQIAATFGWRRAELEKLGAVSFTTLRHPSDVRYATEEFFALDAVARRGHTDAVLSRSDVTTFVRALTRMLATIGKCRIERLAVGGIPIAMSIVIAGGDRDYVWKLAAHPAHAAFCPEGQLVLAQMRADPHAPPLALADRRNGIGGCPESAQIWTDALAVADLALALPGSRNHTFATATRRRTAWHRARRFLGR